MWQLMKSSLRGMALLIAVFALFAGQPAGATPITIGTGPLAAVPGSAGAGLSGSYYSFGSTEATSWAQASSL